VSSPNAFRQARTAIAANVVQTRRRLSGRNLSTSIKLLLNPALQSEYILAHWWAEIPNWGDAINPILIEWLSGRKVLLATYLVRPASWPVYSVIGSVIGASNAATLEVWGSGCKAETSTFRRPPAKIHAVRGPATRELILKQGLPCPAIYGDPALLFPRYYHPDVPKQHDLGIIPHFKDRRDPAVLALREQPGVHIIDILGDPKSVVDQICACRTIASSSLHGVIAADAYRVPSVWIEFSADIGGGGFKFRDYFRSVGRGDRAPVHVSSVTSVQQIQDSISNYAIDIDLDKLVEACPFARV
jgi:pyruvyltransferase